MEECNTAAWSEILVQAEGLKQTNRWSPMEINERGEGGNTRRLIGGRNCLEAKSQDLHIIDKLPAFQHDNLSCNNGNFKI